MTRIFTCPITAIHFAAMHIGANNGNRSMMQQAKLEREELRPFSHSFRCVTRDYADGTKSVEIYANDDGCVNQGALLATCFLDGADFPNSFYYEA